MNILHRVAASCFAVLFVSADLGRRAEKAIVPKITKMLQEKKAEKEEKEKRVEKSEMLERAFYEMII